MKLDSRLVVPRSIINSERAFLEANDAAIVEKSSSLQYERELILSY
jgi:hypothetical protein